jgi:acetyl/propionyl-CoA carboxylase alpha subunit
MAKPLETYMKKISLTIDGQILEGFVERVGKDNWVRVNGKTFKAESSSRKKRSGAQAVLNPNQINAPMPGKITALKKKSGDPVKTGDAVIMMEAMKMEYTLKANMDGKIKSINVKEGDQVTAGLLLAEIQSEKS